MTIEYKYLPVTMQTCYVKLLGSIDFQTVFYLLKIYPVPGPKVFDRKELPFVNVPGAILSVRDEKCNSRGLCRGKSIKNSITMDVCNTTQNVSVKLSTKTIHFSGVTSIHMAMEAAVHVINNINKIQDYLDWFHTHRDEGDEILNWIITMIELENNRKLVKDEIQVCLGRNENVIDKILNLFDLKCLEENDLEWLVSLIKENNNIDIIEDKIVEKFNIKRNMQDNIPKHFNIDFTKYIINMIPDYDSSEVFIDLISKYHTITKVIDRWTKPAQMININVNHNFNLRHRISRNKLARVFSELPDYNVTWRNDVNVGVKLELKYDIPPELENRIVRSSGTHSFTVYATGSVTHSGPHQLLNEIAYNKFMTDFNNNVNRVINRNPDEQKIKIKYIHQAFITEWRNKLEDQYNRNRSDIYADQILVDFKLRSLHINPPPELINIKVITQNENNINSDAAVDRVIDTVSDAVTVV